MSQKRIAKRILQTHVRGMKKINFKYWAGFLAIFAGFSGNAESSTTYERHVSKEVELEFARANKIKTGYFVDETTGSVVIHTIFRYISSEDTNEPVSTYLGSTQTELPGLALSASKSEIVFTHEGRSITCARLSKKKSPFGMTLLIVPTDACTVSSEFSANGAVYGNLDVSFKAEF